MYISEKIKIKIVLFLTPILLLVAAGVFFGVKIYPGIFKTEAFFQASEKIDPEQTITILFSRSMRKAETEKAISIFPSAKVNFSWAGDKKILIKPETCWNPKTEYTIYISAAKSRMFTVLNTSFHFETVDYPTVDFFYPVDGAEDVILDIEEPIRVKFDKSLAGFKVKIVITPFHPMTYNISFSEKNEISLLSKNELKMGQDYKVQVFIRHRKEHERDYREIHESVFRTKSPPPVNWEKDFSLRLQQAKKFTVAKIREGKYIDLNLKTQIMSIFEDGKVLDTYLVSSGKRGMSTPQGNFKIANKHPRAWSKRYGLFMPFWMAIVPSGFYGIHELPEWPGGYKEGASHLGTPVSHGCVRLGVGAAERVYNWAEIGTPVVIYE